MRLTLRTLLAYLDSNLPADQADELEQKIRQSEPAQQLIARIREVQQRIRLGAPSVHGRGTGGDPNSVAEYLDNRLRSEKTAEIEKICIESDMQLAEVAACHQILSQILGKPLQSPHELRQRLYALQDLDINEGQPHADADFVRPAATAAVAVPASDHGGSHGAWYYVLVGALSLSITLVVLAAGTYLLGGFSGNDQVANGDPAETDSDVPTVEGDPRPPLVGPADDEKASDAEAEAAADREDADATTVIPVDKTPLVGDGDAPREGSIPPPESPGNGLAGSSDPAMAPTLEGVTTEDEAPPAPTVGAAPTLVVGPTPIGTVANVPEGSNLVAIIDAQNVDASRVPTDGQILTGESYVTFPLFESAIYASPFHFRFLGDSHWGFEGSAGDGTLTLHMEQGTVRIVADQPVDLSVRLNGHVEAISFEEPGSELAIRVSVDRFPGDDPREIESPHVAEYCLIKGRATLGSPTPPLPLELYKPMQWTEGVGIAAVPAAGADAADDPTSAEATSAVEEAPAAEGEAPAASALPTWAEGDVLEPLDESAVTEILKALPQERSLKLSLTEIVVSTRQEEVQAIAAWALCSLAYFDPALQSFDDPEQKSYWRRTLSSVRRNLPLSQSSAAALRTAVENKFPDSAENVWSMLIGYSPERLAAGGDAELVVNLERPELAIRVLAFVNLDAITGVLHQYQPQVVENRRRTAVGRWQQMLAAGGIRYLEPPVRPTAAVAPGGAERSAPEPASDSAPGIGELPPIFEESDAPPPPTAVNEEAPGDEPALAP